MPLRHRNRKIVIASHNEGKVREIRELLKPKGFEVLSAIKLNLPEPEENGSTFAENAEIKARECSEKSGLLSLADDSGLVVPALGGCPRDFFGTVGWAEKRLQSCNGENKK